MLARLLIAGFLLAHGPSTLASSRRDHPRSPADHPWPFDLERSWLETRLGVTAGTVRLLGLALVAATIGGFALAALATLGILPSGAWGATVAVGSLASLALLIVGFHRWLFIGIAIDVVLLWVALVAAWTPDKLD